MTEIEMTESDKECLIKAGITPAKWMLATSCSYRRILTACGRPVIIPTNSLHDNHPDLAGSSQDLLLAASSPELLMALMRMQKVLEPAASDFNAEEAEAFDMACALLGRFGLIK